MLEKGKALAGPGTVVGTNVKLTGVLKDLNDISIHGQVDGEVISDKNVLIAETATVKGPISAHVITVAGKVNGAISASEKLEILPNGKVYGSINTSDLTIRSGAVFNGKCSMTKESVEKTEKSGEKEPGEEKTTDKEEKKYELE